MRVTIQYLGQLQPAAGLDTETLDLPAGADAAAALAAAVANHGDDLGVLVFDDTGAVSPSLLVLLNGVPIVRGIRQTLAEGDELSLLGAMAGG